MLRNNGRSISMLVLVNVIFLLVNIMKGEMFWILRNFKVLVFCLWVIILKFMIIINNGVNICIMNVGVSLVS